MTKKKKIISYLLLVVMIVLTFGVMLNNFEWKDILDVLGEADYTWVAIGCGAMLLYAFCEGESMRLILRALGVRYNALRGFVYATIDLYFCAVTPSSTGGAPLMMYYMGQDDIPYAKSSVMVLLNLMMYTLAIVIWTVISLILCPYLLLEESIFFRICLLIGAFFSVGLITLCFLGVFKTSWVERLGNWLIRLGGRLHVVRRPEKWTTKLGHFCSECAECAEILKTHRWVSIWALLLNLAQRAAFFVVSYTAYRALGFEGDVFVRLFAIQALMTLAVYSIPLPGAVGASEAMFLILYEQIYSEDERVAAMLLTRGISYYANVLFCAAVTMINHLRLARRDRSLQLPPEER